MYKKKYLTHKPIKICLLVWVLLEALMLMNRKRCENDGSQSYDIPIAVGPSQWHLK